MSASGVWRVCVCVCVSLSVASWLLETRPPALVSCPLSASSVLRTIHQEATAGPHGITQRPRVCVCVSVCQCVCQCVSMLHWWFYNPDTVGAICHIAGASRLEEIRRQPPVAVYRRYYKAAIMEKYHIFNNKNSFSQLPKLSADYLVEN